MKVPLTELPELAIGCRNASGERSRLTWRWRHWLNWLLYPRVMWRLRATMKLAVREFEERYG